MRWKNFFLIIFSVLIASCAEMNRKGEQIPANALKALPLSIQGESLAEFRKNRSLDDIGKDRDLTSLLDPLLKEFKSPKKYEGQEIDLKTGEGRDELRRQIRRLRQKDARFSEIAAPLRGISGFVTAQLLSALDGGDPNAKGQVRDYVFLDETKEGHLSVDMTIDHYSDGVVYEREFVHWDIAIEPGGFETHKRQGNPNDPSDPHFPDNPYPHIPESELMFPDASLDPNHEFSMWVRGLNHKLYAKGELNIKVTDVYQKINNNSIVRLPSEGDDPHPYYILDEKSCVDMMTKGYPPKDATELFAVDGDYCLGRCAMPFIINSGGY